MSEVKTKEKNHVTIKQNIFEIIYYFLVTIHIFTISLTILRPGFPQKVTYTKTNLPLKAAGMFQHVWPFSGHQAFS